MSSSDHFKCACQHCGSHIEAPSEAAGVSIECPHCGKETALVAPAIREKPGASLKIMIGLAVGALVLATAIMIALFVHQRAAVRAQLQRQSEAAAKADETKTAAVAHDPIDQAGWRVSTILLEKTPGGTIVHAVGTLQNESERRRFGVKIHLDLFDAADAKVGSTKDYQQAVEPHGTWQFSALVLNSKAVAAKVTSVEESP
jgi:predicted RNA-binding Zn-ribbon protein involved in translation (DUF1610 family)